MSEIKKFKRLNLKDLLHEKNLLEFNREISDIHTKRILESILECGLLRLPVIGDISAFDANRKYVIIDGQHLCNAIIRLPRNRRIEEVDVIVKVYNNKEEVISDIAKLNNAQKVWNDENYLDAWFKFGKDNLDYFTNYSYLWNVYNHTFDGLPCGFIVDLYAESKDSFKEGTLTFRDREFSDKLGQICLILKNDFNKGSFTLHGLRMWGIKRKFGEKKEIDFKKLRSRLSQAIRNKEDANCNGREDFRDFVQTTYTRL